MNGLAALLGMSGLGKGAVGIRVPVKPKVPRWARSRRWIRDERTHSAKAFDGRLVAAATHAQKLRGYVGRPYRTVGTLTCCPQLTRAVAEAINAGDGMMAAAQKYMSRTSR